MINKFNEFIAVNELQNINYLYHFTSMNNAESIIRKNIIEANSSFSISKLSDDRDLLKNSILDHLSGVSFTRDRSFLRDPWSFSGNRNAIGLVFDRNKLKSKYKIYKYDVERTRIGSNKNLAEEIIIGDINKVDKLLEFIYIDTYYFNNHIPNKIDFCHKIADLMVLNSNIDFKIFTKGNFKSIDFGDWERNNLGFARYEFWLKEILEN